MPKYCLGWGLIDGKIGFGVTDKEVMRFVSECSELNEETIAKTLYCIDVLNSIVDNNCIPIKYMSCNARAMKSTTLYWVLYTFTFKSVHHFHFSKQVLFPMVEFYYQNHWHNTLKFSFYFLLF